MKRTKILFWVFTILSAALMIFSAIPNIMKAQGAIDLVVTQLGYPMYFLAIIGWAKLAGSIAILVPGFPRIKEWAYAGLTYDLVAATLSTIAMGESFLKWWPMLLFIGLIVGSYYFYHQRLKESAV